LFAFIILTGDFFKLGLKCLFQFFPTIRETRLCDA